MRLIIVLVALFGTVYPNAIPTLIQHHEQQEYDLPYDEEAHMTVVCMNLVYYSWNGSLNA